MEVLRSIWLFIQNQVLGMKWLNEVIGNGLNALGVDITSRWGGSIQFFIYDVIKGTIEIYRPVNSSVKASVWFNNIEKLIHSERYCNCNKSQYDVERGQRIDSFITSS